MRSAPVGSASTRRRIERAAVAAVVLAVVLLSLPWLMGLLAASRLQSMARSRGLLARWVRAEVALPARFAYRGFMLVDARGDTLLSADSLAIELDPLSLILLRGRVASVGTSHVRIQMPRRSVSEADTLLPDTPRPTADKAARAERVRRSAESLVRALFTPARRLPRLSLTDVSFHPPRGDAEANPAGARLAWLAVRPTPQGVRVDGAGTIEAGKPLPFDLSLIYGHDDRLIGGARVQVPGQGSRSVMELRLSLDGAVAQDRHSGMITMHDTTRIQIGDLAFRLGAHIDRRGPRIRFSLRGTGFSERQVKQSLPPVVLGELLDVGVRGRWDYRLALDLDLENPDSVTFEADVVSHGLALDPARTRLRLLGLEEPFAATIRLPGDQATSRDLSNANPHYRPLTEIAPALVHAVVTNEDGGFYRHRGFNTGAVREAIAENLRAGAFRRGAGTITMQVARNLYLGHERSLSRKFREVVLAWVLEHLTGISKERLLEIYLNIIEWGPAVHGADEAARFYFDHDAHHLTVDQALFLATVVPGPRKWRQRFDSQGELRPFVRAQMHFIGRAMIAKGWLTPEELVGADSFKVELQGPARAIALPDSLEPREPPAGEAGDPAPPQDPSGDSAGQR